MSVLIEDKQDCCGCTACVSICPHRAISMTPDSLGFLYPEVDYTKCTECGLCEKVCDFNLRRKRTTDQCSAPDIYAGKHKDVNEVALSQSGAAFVALSDWILDNGGVVYGVGYGEHFAAIHKKAVTKEERDEFRGSKYVQSDLNSIFPQIKKELQDGLLVMFSGTPCQVAGLSSYIGKKLRANLFLVDIVCHGVPSPKMWQDYLLYLEGKEKMKIIKPNFRNKEKYGWRSHVESFEFENGTVYTYPFTFYSNINIRLSCGICPYTNMHRPSDVTIADFWGIEKTDAAELGDDNKGCSLFIVNNDKGRDWFDAIKSELIYKHVELNENWLQPQLRYPMALHPKRMAFEIDYSKLGFEKTMKKYLYLGYKKNILMAISKILPTKIKNMIKRFLSFI